MSTAARPSVSGRGNAPVVKSYPQSSQNRWAGPDVAPQFGHTREPGSAASPLGSPPAPDVPAPPAPDVPAPPDPPDPAPDEPANGGGALAATIGDPHVSQ